MTIELQTTEVKQRTRQTDTDRYLDLPVAPTSSYRAANPRRPLQTCQPPPPWAASGPPDYYSPCSGTGSPPPRI